jgi:alpha,alpha-trehalase
MTTGDYIRENFPRSFRSDANGSGFCGIDLPHPYTTPCVLGEGAYAFFFYWDTYFTNLGLLRCGHSDMVKNNIRNILWLIRRHGFMPNHVGIANRSQSPYLCRMVKSYLAATGDSGFLPECAEGLLAEYHFWMAARLHPSGLNHHGAHDTWEGLEKFADIARVRAVCPGGRETVDGRRAIGAHYLAEAEATCDFTPRFDRRCLDHIQPDLNGLLWEYERFFATHGRALEWNLAVDWNARAERRRELINRYLWSPVRGLYLDHDTPNARHSAVAALSGVQLLAHGIPDAAQAARIASNLPLFEREHGIAYTEECPEARSHQWAYPNVWPPTVYMTVTGLSRYGFHEAAARIARKYLHTTDRLFKKTGQLWEKTDAETGDVAGGEYEAAPMLGWTAGVYLALAEFVSSRGTPVRREHQTAKSPQVPGEPVAAGPQPAPCGR